MEIILEDRRYIVVERESQIGDLVVLTQDTIYPEEPSNPQDTLGRITSVDFDKYINVRWSNDRTNGRYLASRDLHILEDALSATYLKTQSNKFKIY